jgi:uncharacterized protein (DUF433 family)/DNA-binding transcriptional MerR regulator
MAFPTELTAILSGASTGQLANWRTTDLIRPEIQDRPKALYSFRDVLALRTFVHLRKDVSLQKIRVAMRNLRDYDLTDHPSTYKLVSDQRSVILLQDDGATDLVLKKGQRLLGSMDDVFAPFTNLQGQNVIDFRRPRPNLEVRERRLGGWPTISGTRVPYDTVALLLRDGTVGPEEASNYYPRVSPAAAMDATDFDEAVRRLRSAG